MEGFQPRSLLPPILHRVGRDFDPRDRNLQLARLDVGFGGNHIERIFGDEHLARGGDVLSHFGGAVDRVAEAVFVSNDEDSSVVNAAGDVDVEIVGGQQVSRRERVLHRHRRVHRRERVGEHREAVVRLVFDHRPVE